LQKFEGQPEVKMTAGESVLLRGIKNACVCGRDVFMSLFLHFLMVLCSLCCLIVVLFKERKCFDVVYSQK